MASGYTTTGSLADSLDDMVSAARVVNEQVGVVPQLCDRQPLGSNIGLSWNEVSFAALSAQAITETTVLDNPQQLSDSLLTVTPTVIGLSTLITDRVKVRINKQAYAKLGELNQNAIQRKKDLDGITAIDGATTQLCGTGTTLTSGYIAAGKVRITSNTTEPGPDPVVCVLHGYQIKDLADELIAGVGTYPVGDGATADVFKTGFTLPIAGVTVYEDGNIPIVSNDAKGGIFSKMGLLLIEGRAPWAKSVRREDIGGGADVVYFYDEYAYGERSAGNWMFEIMSDATPPTS